MSDATGCELRLLRAVLSPPYWATVLVDDGIYVEDDGPGIPENKRDDVFDAGYSTAEDGTGFGLSIVKQVAEAHGWRIQVTDGTGGGARFEIRGVEFAAE